MHRIRTIIHQNDGRLGQKGTDIIRKTIADNKDRIDSIGNENDSRLNTVLKRNSR